MTLIPDLPNVSLVAFYNQTKPSKLKLLISSIQSSITEIIKDEFISYSLEQIHATIIGCEGLKTERGILSKWYWENRKEEKYINLDELLEYTRDRVPISIQIGGYDSASDYKFLSQNQHPYERSFQIINNLAVLRGWPCKERQISLEIDRFRRQCQKFNLLHKYHQQPDSVDNDLYMRIGVFKGKLSDETIIKIEKKIRDRLKKSLPINLLIDRECLNFIQYGNLSASPDATQIISLNEATVEILEKLYP
jgi:hypothetical protein